MKNYVILLVAFALCLSLIGCEKKERRIHFNQKITPRFLTSEKFSDLFQDSISQYEKTNFSTLDARFNDYSNEMDVKPINLRAANYKDDFSRFQIVQYDDDFNSTYSDSTDKIFINTFESKYLHTINHGNFINYKEELLVNVSDLYYKIIFFSDDQILVEKVDPQSADLVFDDRMPDIELQNFKGDAINLYDLIAEGDSYLYHMAYDCKPCLSSIPEINKFKKENPNVNIIGLVTRGTDRQHLDKLNNLTKDWGVFGVSNSRNDNHQKIFKGLPEMHLIDSQGYFLSTNTWINSELQ